MADSFAVDGIDHVELFVADAERAHEWYAETLGFTPDDSFEEWWETGTGPLVLTVEDAGPKLALFEREDAERGDSVSPHRVAFGTDAAGFGSFLDRLESLAVTNRAGDPISPDDVRDHGLSYSVYFTDPDGNRLELTTYDYEAVSEQLADRTE
jgi:catechol 2,3-dioxygenase-like lactoylglutathione lyase family enzyme